MPRKPTASTSRLANDAKQNEPNAAGFTLIEMTVVLSVIATLALSLTPSMTSFINDARVTRARNDTQTLATEIVQFEHTTGFFPQWSKALNGGPGTPANKIDLLVSSGNVPAVAQANTWTTGTTDTVAHQLLNNTPAYTLKSATSPFGWNGPYLTSEIGADAWNNRYMVNVGLIDNTQGVQGVGGATKSAVWVISAGPNGAIETNYSQSVTAAVLGGDDLGVRIQ